VVIELWAVEAFCLLPVILSVSILQQNIALVRRTMNNLTCPARVTNALVTEESINTHSMFAGTGTTKVDLLVATLASES
jgi:hypothetical protein